MVDYKQDLWPDEIKSIEVVSPVTIIKEQGKILGRKTNNIVVGEVTLSKTHPGITSYNFAFYYKFFLVCSSIDYKYQLFSFGLPIDMYPVTIFPDSSIGNDLGWEQKIQVNSEKIFIEALRKIFSAQKTIKIITTLLAQSQDTKDES